MLQIHMQQLDHRPVLRSTDDSAIRDSRRDLHLPLEKEFHRGGAGKRVGIRVVVREDQYLPLAQFKVEQPLERIAHGRRVYQQ